MDFIDKQNKEVAEMEKSFQKFEDELTSTFAEISNNWAKEKQFQSQLDSYTSINSSDRRAIIKEAKSKSKEINTIFSQRKNELLNQGTAATQEIIGAAQTENQVIGGAVLGTGLTILGQVSAEKQRKQAQQKLENEKQLAINKIVQPIIQEYKIYKEKMLKAASLSVFENEEIYYIEQYDYANCMQKNANKIVESNYSCAKPKTLKPKKTFDISGQSYYDSFKRKRKSEITDIFYGAETLLELAIEKEPNNIDWLYEKSKLYNLDIFDKFLILQKLKRLKPENLTFVSELNKIEKKFNLDKEEPNYFQKIKELEKESKIRKRIGLKIKKATKAKPWMIIANVPIFPGCKKNKKNYKNKECFNKKLRNHFDKETNFKILRENNIKRIFIALLISQKGEFTLTSIRTFKKNILLKTVIAEIERVITLLPQLKPTIFDNDPITLKYILPLIIK